MTSDVGDGGVGGHIQNRVPIFSLFRVYLDCSTVHMTRSVAKLFGMHNSKILRQHDCDAITSFWRYNDVIITSSVRGFFCRRVIHSTSWLLYCSMTIKDLSVYSNMPIWYMIPSPTSLPKHHIVMLCFTFAENRLQKKCIFSVVTPYTAVNEAVVRRAVKCGWLCPIFN